MADSFGIYRESATIVRSFKNGVQVERRGHPSRTGGNTTVLAIADVTAHVERIEWRDAPFGTLLDAFDWNDFAGWTKYEGAGGDPNTFVTINPAGTLEIVGTPFSAGAYTAQPTNPGYVELQGVTFPAGDGIPDGWVMVSMWMGTENFGQNGYRVLLRPDGSVQMPDATDILDPGDPISPVADAWRVGSIGFSV